MIRKFNQPIAVLIGIGLLTASAPAWADDYTDLLSILRAKGSLTQAEYDTLLAKHTGGSRAARSRTAQRRNNGTPVSPAEAAADDAQRAADEAKASAAQAKAAMDAMTTSPDVVHAMPYTPGKGMTIRVGQVDLNFSGFINGYYTYSTGSKKSIAGGLNDQSGFDSSAVRDGLLPSALIFKASTTQNGIDLSAVFGIYPGINTSKAGALGANSGGNPVGLGTAGVDFRQIYMTAGTPTFGTVKIGRDLGIFGSDAILSDQTLLGVGAPGGNANPGNTSLGRIGIGYLYADFMPQITYISPTVAGFQATAGVFQPLDEFDYSGYSASTTRHNTPMFQGKLTYDYKAANWAARLWGGFLVQPQEGVMPTTANGNTKSVTAVAGEAGAKLTFGPASLVGYYYQAHGVGSTALMFDGIADNGNPRGSQGYYVQAGFKPVPKLNLVASYGQSGLNQAAGEVSPSLVRRNEAEVGGAYYSLTDWLTLVAEYAHVDSISHGNTKSSQDAVSLGAILFF